MEQVIGSEPGEKDKGEPMGYIRITLLGVYYIVVASLLVYILYRIWPSSATYIKETASENVSFFTGLLTFSISPEVRLILIVLASGGLGSFIHGGTSLATYAGNRRLKTSWTWWYILRPFFGGTLALVFYFVIRAGFLSASAGIENLSHFGIAGIAGIVGMFSKEAIDKLHEIFLTLLRHEDKRADKLEEPKEEGAEGKTPGK